MVGAMSLARYKSIALGVVRGWDASPANIVDKHVIDTDLRLGFVVGVVGEVGSGKTSLALVIAERLHSLGFRCPAIIDEPAIGLFHGPYRQYQEQLSLARKVYEMSIRERTPTILVVNTVRNPVLARALRHPVLAHGGHDLMYLSNFVWAASAKNNAIAATLVKSRLMNADQENVVHFKPRLNIDLDNDPYIRRGNKMARDARNFYG